MKKKSTHWYVHPLDAFTNEVVAKQLAKTSDVEEVISLEVEGKTIHSLYGTPDYSVITLLYANKASQHLSFQVFCRVGAYGKAKEWKFGEKTAAKKNVKSGKAVVKV